MLSNILKFITYFFVFGSYVAGVLLGIMLISLGIKSRKRPILLFLGLAIGIALMILTYIGIPQLFPTKTITRNVYFILSIVLTLFSTLDFKRTIEDQENKSKFQPFYKDKLFYIFTVFFVVFSIATIYEMKPSHQQETADYKTSGSVNSRISISKFPEKVKPGGKAKVSIIGQPYTEYKITVFYSSGPSQSKDLHSKKSDKNGSVSWEWQVGSQTKPGKYKVLITGNGDSLELTLNVTKIQ